MLLPVEGLGGSDCGPVFFSRNFERTASSVCCGGGTADRLSKASGEEDEGATRKACKHVRKGSRQQQARKNTFGATRIDIVRDVRD